MGRTFTLKHVKNGAALDEDSIPGLPPRAALLMLETYAKADDADAAHRIVELQFKLVHAALRRIEPGLTLQQLMDDESYDEVAALAELLRQRTPSLFPPVAASAAAPEVAQPSPKGPAPA